MDRYRTNNRPCCEHAPQQKPCAPMREGMYGHADQMVPAMAYVPMQKWEGTFDPGKGLEMGTIFPSLCRPFCGRGKRGGCK